MTVLMWLVVVGVISGLLALIQPFCKEWVDGSARRIEDEVYAAKRRKEPVSDTSWLYKFVGSIVGLAAIPANILMFIILVAFVGPVSSRKNFQAPAEEYMKKRYKV